MQEAWAGEKAEHSAITGCTQCAATPSHLPFAGTLFSLYSRSTRAFNSMSCNEEYTN